MASSIADSNKTATNILRAMPGPELKASFNISRICVGGSSMASSNHMIGSRKLESFSVFGKPVKTGDDSIIRFICIRTWTEIPSPIVGWMSIRNPWSSSFGMSRPSIESDNVESAKWKWGQETKSGAPNLQGPRSKTPFGGQTSSSSSSLTTSPWDIGSKFSSSPISDQQIED